MELESITALNAEPVHRAGLLRWSAEVGYGNLPRLNDRRNRRSEEGPKAIDKENKREDGKAIRNDAEIRYDDDLNAQNDSSAR